MTIPLQKTKLFIPPSGEKWVHRPRLMSRLEKLLAVGCRAALLSAPTGSGKTSLIVQWLNRQKCLACWLSLDGRDNLPARFFSYLITALQAVAPGAGREALSLLELPAPNPEEIITLLTNDLVDFPELFILVLDDFHIITNPLLHQAVDLLIEAQPPQMRLVLLSREDPPLHLARRRARGQLVELRQTDLSFTTDEALEFLNQHMALRLTTGQVEILEARTEGWIAGLQMAALALQTPPTNERLPFIERFLQNFSSSHRFIIDYLMEEVLARQEADVQAFLLNTSILDRLQAGLCAAVTGKTAQESQKLLEQISKANLFVIPLDDERRWFRYHHLFGDLLFARLQFENPSRAADLYERASNWYEANGDPRLAVEFTLRAENYQRAADLIARHITERWQTVDLEFFKLVNRLPLAVIAERPALCLQSAWLCVISGQTEQILPLVETAERALAQSDYQIEKDEETNATASRAFARTLRAYLADLDNQSVILHESLALTYAAIPETNPGMRNSVAVVIGTIYYMEGDFRAAMRLFEDALALDRKVNGTNAVPIATTRIWLVLQTQGRLREGMQRLRESEDYVRERGVRRFYISGALNLRIAEILLEWNHLDEAEELIHEGIRLLVDWTSPGVHCLALSLLARVCIARFDLAGGRSALAQADAIRQQTGLHPIFVNAIERAWLQLLLVEGSRDALADWVEQHTDQLQQPVRFRYEASLIELCRAWVALGREEQASGLLVHLAEAAQNRKGSRVAILALLAAALYRQPEKAVPIVEEALRLAEPEGYLRTFLEAGEMSIQVLRGWLQHGQSKDDPRLRAYVQAILSAGDHPAMRTPTHQVENLPEPLSQREQEVLGLVAKGLSNQQIADRLVISVRTVKKHVENIHGKLSVNNRTQAVVRAQELGLL